MSVIERIDRRAARRQRVIPGRWPRLAGTTFIVGAVLITTVTGVAPALERYVEEFDDTT